VDKQLIFIFRIQLKTKSVSVCRLQVEKSENCKKRGSEGERNAFYKVKMSDIKQTKMKGKSVRDFQTASIAI
jgi:hypothetical protein